MNSELLALTLPTLLHPADVVPVMRQLKEAGTSSNLAVSLLYRIRRKQSGWIWIEAKGRMHSASPHLASPCLSTPLAPPFYSFRLSVHLVATQWLRSRMMNDRADDGSLDHSRTWQRPEMFNPHCSTTRSLPNVLGRSKSSGRIRRSRILD